MQLPDDQAHRAGKALLRRGALSVTEVCVGVGCTSPCSFSSRFTELVGESPSAYRARGHDATTAVPACCAKAVTRPLPPAQRLSGPVKGRGVPPGRGS